jgi:hypothetical protein
MQNYDCDGDGCGECRVCEYLDFLEYVSQVAPGTPHTIERDVKLDKYIKEKYGVVP